MGFISPVADLYIKEFAGGSITLASSLAKNVVYDKYPENDRWFATQRPSINIFENASDTVADVKGRGVYYWNKAGIKVFINDDTIYTDAYSGTKIGGPAAISSGTEPVGIFEVGDHLVILDYENQEGWYIDSATPTVITQITDADFPTEQTPALVLAKGGAVLNGRLHVLTSTGDIYASDLEDGSSWGALNFLNAEVEPDGGVYLGKHHQHVVAIGPRSMEFFYDAGNPTGQVLSARTDIDWDIGAVDRYSFWEEADMLFFVGFTASGGVGVYRLENFAPVKISRPSLDTFLGSSIISDNVKVLGSGFQVGGRIYYVLTLYNLVSTIQTTETLVYEMTSNTWNVWDLMHTGIDDCPIVGWTESTTTRLGEGMLSNGDLVTAGDDNSPQDTVAGQIVFESGVFEDGVFTNTGGSGSDIACEIITGIYDLGTRDTKFEQSLQVIATPIDSGTMLIQTSDEDDADWNTGRSVDISSKQPELRANGSYTRRNRRLTFTLSEQYRLEGLSTVESAGFS